MPGLTAVGTLSYNGYTFAGASEVKASFEAVKDDALRTVVCNKLTLTVSTVIQNDNATDQNLENVRTLLSKQGAPLIFINRGFGTDLRINTPGSTLKDIRFGPIPEVLEWESVGSAQACAIVWKVTAYLPPVCPVGGFKTSGVMALNWTASYEIVNGFTNRTITGYIEIAQTRNGRTLPDCADAYRKLLTMRLPDDFRRRETHNISLNKSRLDFSINDQQIQSRHAFPEGFVQFEWRHRANWSRSGGQMRLRNTISLECELAPGLDPSIGWKAFGDLVARRISHAANAGAQSLGGQSVKQFPIIESVDAEENSGYGQSFSCTYRILTNLAAILQSTGMWQPIGTDWGKWQQSMQKAKTHDHRGYAGMLLNPGTDAIVDLCGGAVPFSTGSIKTSGRNSTLNARAITNKYPPSESSWISYQQQVIPSRERPVHRHSIMQSPDTREGVLTQQGAAGLKYPNAGGTSDVLQESGRSSYSCVYLGKAMRAGYEIPRPAMPQVGDQFTTEVRSSFAQSQVGIWFGVPIYLAQWAIEYALPNSPGEVATPNNLEQPRKEQGGFSITQITAGYNRIL